MSIQKNMKKLKVKLLQRVANVIVKKIKNSKSDKEQNYWVNMGESLDAYCVGNEIYLD